MEDGDSLSYLPNVYYCHKGVYGNRDQREEVAKGKPLDGLRKHSEDLRFIEK